MVDTDRCMNAGASLLWLTLTDAMVDTMTDAWTLGSLLWLTPTYAWILEVNAMVDTDRCMNLGGQCYGWYWQMHECWRWLILTDAWMLGDQCYGWHWQVHESWRSMLWLILTDAWMLGDQCYGWHWQVHESWRSMLWLILTDAWMLEVADTCQMHECWVINAMVDTDRCMEEGMVKLMEKNLILCHAEADAINIYARRTDSFHLMYEPPRDKTNKMTVRPANSDQHGHPPSLFRVFAVRSMGS